MSDCMTCKRTSIPLTGEDLKSPSGQQTVEALLESEAKKYNLPKPKVLFQEESTFCKHTNCTIMHPRNPVPTTKIYFNPQASNFSTKSIFHEWYNDMASILGREKTKQVVKQVLGIDVQGDPDSEEEADIFALKEMENMP